MPDRDEVLAWMKATGAGYKSAAKHFGLDLDVVTAWGREARGSAPRARTRATTDATSAALAGPKAAPLAWDPATCTREDFLVRALTRCLDAATATLTADPGVARQWEELGGKYRVQLDDHRAMEAARAAVREAADRMAAALTAGDESTILRLRLEDHRRDLERARLSGGNSAAIAALQRAVREIEDRLLHLRPSNAADDLPEDQLVQRLRDAARDLPEDHLRLFADEWLQRHRLRAVPDDTLVNRLVERDAVDVDAEEVA